MRAADEPREDLFRRRAEFVCRGIPHELYLERTAWARRAHSAALFKGLVGLFALPLRWFGAFACRLVERVEAEDERDGPSCLL